MGYQPLEELLPKSGYSNYKLCRMAADRALELGNGKKALIYAPLNQKLATTALEEIRAGKVVVAEVAAEFHPDKIAADLAAKEAEIEDEE